MFPSSWLTPSKSFKRMLRMLPIFRSISWTLPKIDDIFLPQTFTNICFVFSEDLSFVIFNDH